MTGSPRRFSRARIELLATAAVALLGVLVLLLDLLTGVDAR
jgi:hypothetical protein